MRREQIEKIMEDVIDLSKEEDSRYNDIDFDVGEYKKDMGVSTLLCGDDKKRCSWPNGDTRRSLCTESRALSQTPAPRRSSQEKSRVLKSDLLNSNY